MWTECLHRVLSQALSAAMAERAAQPARQRWWDWCSHGDPEARMASDSILPSLLCCEASFRRGRAQPQAKLLAGDVLP